MLIPGDVFMGYRIEEFLGAGGSGSVYRAIQEGLEREVALKVVAVGSVSGVEERKRFMREARALARLAHPHIVRIYDFGETGDRLYYSMEYAPGLSVDRRLKQGSTFAKEEAVEIMLGVLDALDTVHALGVLHRDVKPANVLVRPSGGVLLSDFGLAREREATRMTREGVLLGTLPYFPPEMCRQSESDARADLYQAGVMFYELLMGETPYTPQQILEVLKGGPLDRSTPIAALGRHVEPDLASVIERAIEADPAKRYPSAAEMADAIRACETEPSGRLELTPVAHRSRERTAPRSTLPGRASRKEPAVESQRTLTAPIALDRNHRVWLAAGLVGVVCWTAAIVVGYRALSSHEGAVPVRNEAAPEAPAASEAAPGPVTLQSQRIELVRELKERLLAETVYPLFVTDVGGGGSQIMEALVPAAEEVVGVQMRSDDGAGRGSLRSVNGVNVDIEGGAVPASLLIRGNNRFELAPGGRADARLFLELARGRTARVVPSGGTGPPELVDAQAAEMATLTQQGIELFQAGRYLTALQSCQQAVDMTPASWEGFWRKGHALHQLSYASRAVEAAGPMLGFLNPVEQPTQEVRVQEFEHFNRALELRADAPGVWFDLGTNYRDYRRREDSVRAYSIACSLGSTEQKHWWELARTMAADDPIPRNASSHDLPLAVRIARAAFDRVSPDRPIWLADRSAVFHEAGLLEEARLDLVELLRLEPANRIAADALSKLGRP